MPPRSPFPLLTTPSDSRTAMLQGLLIGVIVIAGLYVAREVLLPLALAILLSFVLTPPLLMLRKIKVPRVLAVGIVVAVAFGFILALGWMMSREATKLAADLPNYQRHAVGEDHGAAQHHERSRRCCKRAGDVLTDLQQQLDKPAKRTPGAKRRHAGVAAGATRRSRSRSGRPTRRDGVSIRPSSARCCRRSPPPASCFCSLSSSCSSARICATGSSGCSAARISSVPPRP